MRKTILILLLAASFMAGDPKKKSQDLPPATTSGTVEVIIQFHNKKDLDKNKHKSANKKSDMDLINGSVYELSPADIDSLSDDPDVKYISPNRGVQPLLDLAAPAVGADLAQKAGWDGDGVGIAIIDSGVTAHLDLGSRVVYNESLHPGGTWTEDRFGHGTHVAGIAAGDGKTSTLFSSTKTLAGIARKANIVNLRVLDENGVGTDTNVIAAIDRAIALKKKYNIRVINLSLGHPVLESYLTDPLCQAAEKAWKAGIVVVVAAGNNGRDNNYQNNGYGTINSPGNDPYVITAGAMKTVSTPSRTDDLVASYSSKGPTRLDHIVKPDLVAPGNRIASLRSYGFLQNNYPQNLVPRSYYSTMPGDS